MQAFSSGKIKGIDVSHHNGSINWSKVKNAGIQFVYVKATEGVSYVDPTFIQNAKGAIAVGLPVGAYHFAHPQNDPIAEAKNFVSQLEKIKYSLLPVIDLETAPAGMTEAQLVQWARKFVNYVKSERNCDVMLYTGIWFINKYNGLTGLEDLLLWAAIYKNSCPDAGGWKRWTIWQFTESGKVDGIAGNVDLNIAEDLNLFKIGGKPMASTPQFVEDNVLPIAKGAKGDLVKKIQQRLNSKVVDGLFGTATEADVKMWQSLHGLTANGVVDEKTYYALFPNEKPQSKPQPKPQPKREPAYDVTVDGKNVMTSAIDANVLKAIADAIKDNKAKEIKIERIDY